jgi:5''-3'' exonuclease
MKLLENNDIFAINTEQGMSDFQFELEKQFDRVINYEGINFGLIGQNDYKEIADKIIQDILVDNVNEVIMTFDSDNSDEGHYATRYYEYKFRITFNQKIIPAWDSEEIQYTPDEDIEIFIWDIDVDLV